MNTYIEQMKKEAHLLLKYENACFVLLGDIVSNQDEEALEYYSSQGFDMNPRNNLFSNVTFFIGEHTSVDFVKKLAEKGVNLHSIDAFGSNILSEEAADSKEILEYLLSIGVNPYEEDFEGKNAFSFNSGNPDLIKIMTEKSLFDNSISLSKALRDKNFTLYLNLMEDYVRNLGGFEKILPSSSVAIQDFLRLFYFALFLNKKYNEANALMNYLVENHMSNSIYSVLEYPYFYDTYFLENNIEGLLSSLQANKNKAKDFGYDKSYLTAYMLLLCMDDVPLTMLDEMKEHLKERLFAHNDSILSAVFRLLSAEGKTEQLRLYDVLNEYVENETRNTHLGAVLSTYYLLGVYHLSQKDYVSAEYMFRQCTLKTEVANERHLYDTPEYFQSYAMIDYLEKKKAE